MEDADTVLMNRVISLPYCFGFSL